MTNLELMICESCNYGEIDTDTRDLMLSVLESTAYNRQKEKKYKELDAKYKDVVKQTQKYRKLVYGLPDGKAKDDATKKLNDALDEMRKLENERSKALTSLEISSLGVGKDNAHNASKYNNLDDDDIQNGKVAKKHDLNNLYGKDIRPKEDQLANKKPGMYAKESVNELRKSIYEAELNGDITVEERAVLIDELDKKMNKYLTESFIPAVAIPYIKITAAVGAGVVAAGLITAKIIKECKIKNNIKDIPELMEIQKDINALKVRIKAADRLAQTYESKYSQLTSDYSTMAYNYGNKYDMTHGYNSDGTYTNAYSTNKTFDIDKAEEAREKARLGREAKISATILRKQISDANVILKKNLKKLKTVALHYDSMRNLIPAIDQELVNLDMQVSGLEGQASNMH